MASRAFPFLLPILAIGLAGAAGATNARQTVDLTIADARAQMLTDPRAAQVKAELAERQSARIADPATRSTTQATALWLEGEASYRLKQFDAAAPKLRQALKLVRQYAPGSTLEGDVLLSSASVHGENGDVVAALTEFQRAHALFLHTGDARKRAIALICIASLYSSAKDFRSSLKYLDEALAAFDGDPGLSVAINNNRGVVLRYLGRSAEAERGFDAALAIADRMESPTLRLQILPNLARTQLTRNDLPAADRTISRAETLVRRLADESGQDIQNVAAQAALQHGDAQQAARLVSESFAGIDLTKTTLTFREAHSTAYRVYRAVGDYRQAFVHLRALKRLDDQATRLATSTGAALMAARFDFANQELRIAKLKADDLERQARFQRYLISGGATATAIVIAALLIGLVVIRRSRDRVRAANADLALANTALGKALAAKTEFLATTSHEIRTPLNGILGMTQVMLADPALPEAMRDRLGVVQGAGKTMRALVDDILDVAKMENGKLVLERAPFDLRATILDATRLWDVQAGAKGIAFRRALDGCPAIVVGDAARVRQVVFNLLSNALKFTEAGEIAIAAEPRADGQVAIAVRDSGIGIPADKLEAIFESFRQADAGTTRQFGGTGLGLAICRQLAQAMGGDVTVESEVGRGSVFTVTLPLPPADAATGQAVAAALAPALLIVDRNPIGRSLYRSLLQPHADRIVFADDAAEAVAMLAEGRITRVLIDDATVSAGGEAIDSVRRVVAAAAGEAEVTLLWRQVEDADRQPLLATGIDHLLLRPVSGPSLVATLFRTGNDSLVRQAA